MSTLCFLTSPMCIHFLYCEVGLFSFSHFDGVMSWNKENNLLFFNSALRKCIVLSTSESECTFKFRSVHSRQKWAYFLKLESSITAYQLPNKENKLPFSVFVCSKQSEVWRFCILFDANKINLQFSVSSVFGILV